MDDEIMLSGYCRAIDQSRMVLVESDSTGMHADCSYPDCPHASACQLAQQLCQLRSVPST
ncbi:MAG: hypothetical protein J6Q53_02995 [Oscillospiraceae bacterium]|nr:hypothetical protein [Oscillospiraceae bacterium]